MTGPDRPRSAAESSSAPCGVGKAFAGCPRPLAIRVICAGPYDAPMQADDSLERRIVTVLFADLVGFTELSERFDAEDVAAIQDSYFGSVRETIGRYGGSLEKFIGDAAMAVFGVPRSGDDDVERAVRAGLALTHAIQQIGAHLGLEDDALRLRVGINTGEVVVAASGPDEGRVTGDTVNTAARLQTAAPPGGVLIGEASAMAVADVAEMESVPPLELKGKAEPTAARLVIGMHAEPSREQAMGELRAPMLGRERELQLLSSAYARAAAGNVERLLIVAPPGVGKSRLLREVATSIETPSTGGTAAASVIWRSRARPDSLSPFDPIARLMGEALSAAAGREAAESELRQRLAAVGTSELRTDVVVDACLAIAWPPATAEDAKPSDDRSALFGAWIEGLDALAGSRTQAWLIEDVHWAGGDVLAFLEEASTGTDSREHGGRLVIATARPSLLDAQPAWAADDPGGGRTVLHLSTLEATDAAGLVRALVGDALPDELVERIAERSDGNCLFIEELLRTWISVGALAPSDGSEGASWRLTVPAGEIPLPQSVQSIYAAQLDDLPPAARRLARRASVAGRRFPVAALEPLGADADDGLQPLRRRALVVGPVEEPVWGVAFSYRHALLRDAGYASLARAERARLHVRLARWLEAAAGEHGDEVAEQIATHYSAALASAPALAREIDDGVDRDAVRRRAAHWFERAGQGSLALSAHDAARQLLRQSIDLTPDETAFDKARRWKRLGDATAFAADMDEGSAAYRKAMEFYRAAIAKAGGGFDAGSDALLRAADRMSRGAEWLASISPEGAAEMNTGASQLRAASNEVQAGQNELVYSLAEARSGLASTAAELANVMYQQLQFEEATAMAGSVIDEVGDDVEPGPMAELLHSRAKGALGAHGPAAVDEEDLRRALELAHQSGDRHVELRIRHGVAVYESESGHDEEVDWAGLAGAAAEAGDWITFVNSTINSTGSVIDDRASEVLGPLDRAREVAVARGMTDDVGWTYYNAAEAHLVTGDWDSAIDAGLRAIELGVANAYFRMTVRTWHVLIPIAAVRGDRAILERAAQWYRSLEGKFEFPDSPYSRVIRAAQDVELAAAGLWEIYVPDVQPRLVSFAMDPGGPSWSAALDRVFRCWIDAGDIDGAQQALAAMTQALSTVSSVSSLGMGTYQLLRGRLAAARGEQGEAILAGRAALDHFRFSDAPWWMAKAIRLLERSGSADADLVAEVEQIEHRLGAIGPTA